MSYYRNFVTIYKTKSIDETPIHSLFRGRNPLCETSHFPVLQRLNKLSINTFKSDHPPTTHFSYILIDQDNIKIIYEL